MTQFFNKAACFTDIHFGMKNNARQHNIDCENFITWFIEQAKERGSETCIFFYIELRLYESLARKPG